MHNLVISFYLESKFLDSLIVLDEFIPNFHIIWMITFMVINFLLICQVKVMRAVFLNFTLLKSFYLALLLILVCFNRSIIRNKLLKWIVKCCLISHFFQLFILLCFPFSHLLINLLLSDILFFLQIFKLFNSCLVSFFFSFFLLLGDFFIEDSLDFILVENSLEDFFLWDGHVDNDFRKSSGFDKKVDQACANLDFSFFVG